MFQDHEITTSYVLDPLVGMVNALFPLILTVIVPTDRVNRSFVELPWVMVKDPPALFHAIPVSLWTT